MTIEKRLNEVKLGETFKRSEAHQGTVTYKKVGELKKSLAYANEYLMRCLVVDCTQKDSYIGKNIGTEVFVTSTIKYGKLGKVRLLT
jgi:hypothetical protein